MPTALALQTILDEVGETLAASNKQISSLTGLSDAQIERCRKLLSFPQKNTQDMSLEVDPSIRIPSNFWIEALPVIDLAEDQFSGTRDEMQRDEITDQLVDKYRARQVKSVIHFRRVMAAWDFAQTDSAKAEVRSRLLAFIRDPRLETRQTFDTFGWPVDGKRVQSTLSSCDEFLRTLERNKLSTVVEGKDELTAALVSVRKFVDELLLRLEGFGSADVNGHRLGRRRGTRCGSESSALQRSSPLICFSAEANISRLQAPASDMGHRGRVATSIHFSGIVCYC